VGKETGNRKDGKVAIASRELAIWKKLVRSGGDISRGKAVATLHSPTTTATFSQYCRCRVG
jgi:hypothetical protein